MKPSNAEFGAGISDWTITGEYVPDLETPDHGKVWGLMCSPSMLPEIVNLTPEDIAARRAHLMVRTPQRVEDIAEMHETIPHELVHVLDANKSGTVADKENTAHSLAPLLAELRKNDPARADVLARALANPAMARAYRAAPAKEGDMPDPTENKKEPDKGSEKPMAQVRSVGEIEADLVKAALAGQSTDDLVKELIAAKIAEQSSAGPASEPAPMPAPTMGMRPEEQAYARKIADATKEAIEAIVEANPHLTDGQKAMARKQSTAKDARELVATYPRPANNNEPAKMGLQGKLSEQGGPAKRVITGGLGAIEGAAMARQMGVRETSAKGPHINEQGRFVLGHMGPTQMREKMSKGWDPRAEFPATVEG